MSIELTQDERVAFLVIMAGGVYRVLYNLYQEADKGNKQQIISALGESMKELEPVMDMYGLGRTPEDVARGMMLTEDLIGCEPRGELLSVSEQEAVRKVTSCPWADAFSSDGETCRLIMKAMEESIGKKYGLEIVCDQNMAEGAEYCIWRVRKKGS